VFDVTVTVRNLPALSGRSAYVAWVTTPDLDDGRKLGVIGGDQTTTGSVSWNKYIVLVTAESQPVGEHWKGPIVLRGFSPSTYLANYSSHPLFLGGMPPCPRSASDIGDRRPGREPIAEVVRCERTRRAQPRWTGAGRFDRRPPAADPGHTAAAP
jgi:hypothetical protein